MPPSLENIYVVCELRDHILISSCYNVTSIKLDIQYIEGTYAPLMLVKYHSLMPDLHSSYLSFSVMKHSLYLPLAAGVLMALSA